jgi:aspartyl-tRNA(Asn)/glutamyl-tRNA(Gln) amidotransferase subunit A
MPQISNNDELTIACLSELIRKKEISPVEVTQFFLERIQKFQPLLNAYITVIGDSALHQAKQAEREIARNGYRGSMHGIPISIKDLICTRGIRTTAGSKILRRFVPKENAAVIDRLQEAGAIILGKTNLHEFAFGVTNANPHFGPARNPWDPERIPGGSSGGSAITVSAAMALASIGTDTGGSIRIPAAACACVGLKPTYGRVSLRGIIPLAGSLDHVGPLTRCVQDAAILLDFMADSAPIISGRYPGAKHSFVRELRKGIRGLRIGLPKNYFFTHISAPVRKNVSAAVLLLEHLGAQVREVALKGMEETGELAGIITSGEALANHWNWINARAQDYGKDVSSRIIEAMNQRSSDYILAQMRRGKYAERLSQIFQLVDVLAVPTIPIATPRLGDDEVVLGGRLETIRSSLLRLTRPANLSGLPAISLPCGFSRDGLPVGLQLIGKRWDEATLLRAAFAFEQATPWHQRFPPEDSRQI